MLTFGEFEKCKALPASVGMESAAWQVAAWGQCRGGFTGPHAHASPLPVSRGLSSSPFPELFFFFF